MEKIEGDKICDDFLEGRINWEDEYYRASDVDAYRQAVKALVENAKSLLALTDCLLGDGMTRGTEPVEIIEARQAIAAVERLGG